MEILWKFLSSFPYAEQYPNIVDFRISRQIRDEESPAEVIVAAIAAAENQNPTSLPPIYDAVAADALNRLLVNGREDVEVSFTYYRYHVSASPTEVVLNPIE